MSFETGNVINAIALVLVCAAVLVFTWSVGYGHGYDRGWDAGNRAAAGSGR